MSSTAPARIDGPPLGSLDQMLWIGDIPQRGAAAHAERIAVIFPERDEQLSYGELEAWCGAFAASLKRLGLQPGDRIAYLGCNDPLFLPVLLGALRAGVVLVPLNWRLVADEIAYQLEDSGARLLFCDPPLQATASRACEALAQPPRILDTTAQLRELLAGPERIEAVPHEPNQTVLQLYTSGTTGRPKGVLLSHLQLSIARHMDMVVEELSYLSANCQTLSAMPNFHIGGMSWVLMTLCRGGTVVLTADPSPGNLLQLMQRYPVEYTFAVATVIRALIDGIRASDQPAPKLKGIFYGAMPIGEKLLRETIETFNCPLMQFFGMTEAAGTATFLPPACHDPDNAALLKSVGRPLPGISIEIRDPQRRTLPRGQHGEIWIQSPCLMSGYWQLPGKTAEAVVDGWYASGDGGYIDEQGFLYLNDRIKDMIVSGGENIYPTEVEEVLRRHPAVLDAAVVGVPDPHWGEKVCAVVELRPGQAADEEALRAFLRERLAGYKCPKTIRFSEGLPRTASGKVRRVDLREQLARG